MLMHLIKSNYSHNYFKIMLTKISVSIAFFAILFSPNIVAAQTTKLINSTQQNWSGGIAGRSGSNYIFIVEFSGFRNEPVPDTIWIKHLPVPIVMRENNKHIAVNTKVIRSKRSVRFEINAATAKDENGFSPLDESKQGASPHCPITCKGVAILSYRCNGKQRYYEITRVMKIYPPVNYPEVLYKSSSAPDNGKSVSTLSKRWLVKDSWFSSLSFSEDSSS